MSVAPAPFPNFVGPLPDRSDPIHGTVAAGDGPAVDFYSDSLTWDTHGGDRTRSHSFKLTYRDDAGIDLTSLDDHDVRVVGPRGYDRGARYVSHERLADGSVVVRYKVAAPVGGWDAGDNGRYTVSVRAGQVFDVQGNAAHGGIVGDFRVALPGVGEPDGPDSLPKLGVSVLDFGAIPNDGRDDTDAIQNAINSLPLGNGVPIGNMPAGGILIFPAGVFDITRSIRLPSGVTLRGAGAATVIHDIGTARNHAAILLYSPFSHRWNVGASVENLTIFSRWGGGVWVDPDMGGDVVDLRLADLRVSTLGPAIDLRQQALYHSDIDNVEVYNPGSTALHVGRYDGHGADVRVRDFKVTGAARSGFRPEQGLVRFGTETFVQGLTITVTGAKVTPVYVRDGGYTSGAGGVTMFGLNLQVAAADCPDGYAIKIIDVSRIDFDFVNNIGINRRIYLGRARDVQIGYLQSDGSTNVLSRLIVRDGLSYYRVGNAAAGRLSYPSRPAPAPPRVGAPAPTNVIDALAFGVIPDDGLDDTLALQRAIDSLPRGGGIPGSGGAAVGGIVQLPLGAINTTGSIKLPSGVWLRGHNNGTVIRNSFLTTRSKGVIELTSPYTHGANVGAGLIQLGIYSSGASGVKADNTVRSELRDLKIVGVRLTTGGPAIDLSNVQVNYALLDRVVVSNPGSYALWLGRADNASTGNVIRGARTAGVARANFATGRAMFVYQGDNTIEGGSIEDVWDQYTTAQIDAFYASGKLKMDGLYMEFPRQENGVGFLFENVSSAEVGYLHMVNPWRRVHLVNSNVHMRHLNIDGVPCTLRDCISVDGTSKLTLNTVNSQWDAGFLDHPRVIVRGVFNGRSMNFVETQVALGANLLADPAMSNITDGPVDANWRIIWGDGVVGTYAVETVNGEKRLKIVILSNPHGNAVSIRAKMNVPASLVGRRAIARWRVDGNTQAFAYRYAYAQQYAARAMKSMTAASTGQTLVAGEQLWIDLPQAAGTYYVWRVGMVAA